MCDNSYSLDLLAVVSSVHHQRACQSLNDWALSQLHQPPTCPLVGYCKAYLSFSESLAGISTGGVRKVDRASNVDVIGQGDIADFYIIVCPGNPVNNETHPISALLCVVPLVEQLDASLFGHDTGGKRDDLAGKLVSRVGHFGWLDDGSE